MASIPIYENHLSKSELITTSGIGPRVAHIIMRIRATEGNVDRSLLEFLIKRPFSEDFAAQFKFTPNLALTVSRSSHLLQGLSNIDRCLFMLVSLVLPKAIYTAVSRMMTS